MRCLNLTAVTPGAILTPSLIHSLTKVWHGASAFKVAVVVVIVAMVTTSEGLDHISLAVMVMLVVAVGRAALVGESR